jgi:cytochrome b561
VQDLKIQYSAGAVFLHWSMALLIAVTGTLGLLHDSWPQSTQGFWINLHAIFGLIVALLLCVRLGWRAIHRPPPLPEEMGIFTRRASSAVHVAMYLLLVALPILGVVTFIWHGRVFDFGIFKIDFGIAKNRSIFHPTEDWHGYLAYALFTLIGLHAVAALWHHFIRRDRLIRRMWFPGEKPARSTSTKE